MKILKIENNKGLFYSFSAKNYLEINAINKEALLNLVDYILKQSDSEIDAYVEGKIQNNVQDIVYKDISEKLIQLVNEKDSIISNIKNQYASSIEKYTKEN